MKSLLWAGLGALLALVLAPDAEAAIAAYCGTTSKTAPDTCALDTDSYISNGVVQANFNNYNGLKVKTSNPSSTAAGLKAGSKEWVVSGGTTREGMVLTWVQFEGLQITNSYLPTVDDDYGRPAYLYQNGARRLTHSASTASVYDTFTQRMYYRSLNFGSGCGLPWTLGGFAHAFCWQYTSALQVGIVHEMGDNQNFMKTSVTIRNVDYRDQENVFFMRAHNPAPDTSTTKTWVRYQHQTYDGNDAVVHPDYPNVGAVVTLSGGERVAFVTANRLGRVNHGSSELHPVQAWGTGNEGNMGWTSTAGDGTGVSDANLFQFITFKKPRLTPGESFTFEYGYAFSESAMETELIPSLVGVNLLYPTSHVSHSTRIVAKVNATTLGQPVTAVNFHLYRQSTNNWITLGTATGPDSRLLYTLDHDFSAYSASTAQLQVEVVLQDGRKHYSSRMLEIVRSGNQLSFPSDSNGEYLFTSSSNHVLDLTESGSGTAATRVFFFLEAYQNGGMESIALPVDSTAPWQVTVKPEDMAPLMDGAIMFIKAVASSGSATSAPAPLSVTMFQGIYRPNSAPTDIKLDKTSIDENRPAGTAVAALTTIDPDVGQGHSYVLTFNPDGAFYIEGSTLLASQSFDYETKSSYEIQIRSHDPYEYIDKTFIITINNVNDLPTIPNVDALTIPENYPLATAITTLVSIDQDGDTISYYLQNNQAFFALGKTTGVLQLASRLDFEATPYYLLAILVQDSQLGSVTTTIPVNVTDVNEAPTQVKLTCATGACVILEKSPIGMWVGNLSAIDQDVGDSHTFEVVNNPYFEVQNDNQLVVKSVIQYHVTGIEIPVQIKVTDNGGLSFTQTMTVVIQDVNDPADAFVTFCNIDEDREEGNTVSAPKNGYTDICQVQVDNSQNYDLTYVIPGEPPENGNLNWTFSVQDCSGIFFVNNTGINFESNVTSYNVTVDVYGPGDAVARTFVIIKVHDVNEPPKFREIEPFEVPENTPSGAVVVPSFLPYTIDEDEDESFQYMFWLEPVDNPFDIDLETGQITVAPGAFLNYEARSVYELKVRVDDRGNLFSITDVTIIVQDLNEAPELVGGMGVLGSIAENSPNGAALSSFVFAIDEDSGQSLTFEIVGGNELGVFGIRNKVGALSPTAELFIEDRTSLDFETNPQFNLTIRATDDGIPPLSDTNWFIVALTDVNEQPFFPAQDFYVSEDIVRQTPVGVPLLNVTEDPDAGDVMTFVIHSYNDDSVGKTFSLSPTTGQLELSALGLSYERKQLYTYQIRVSDQGGLSYSEQVRIHVLDVEEAPVYVGGTYAYILENEGLGTVVQIKADDNTAFLLAAQDDDGDSVTFAIVSVNGAAPGSTLAIEAISETTAHLRSIMTFNYEELNLYQLTISFSDGLFTLYQAVTVQVVDVNDEPVFPSNVVCYTQTTAVEGELVCTVLVTDEDTETSGFRSLEFELLSASASGHPDLSGMFSVNKSASLAFDLSLTGSISANGILPGTEISVHVRVTDGAGASDEGTVKVIVNDVNAPPKCPPNGITYVLAENLPANTEVGDLATSGISDPQGTIANFTLASGGADFWLEGTMLKTLRSFDFETQASYALQIRVTDPEGLATTCVALVVIGDVNEETTLLDQARFVDETAVSGTLRANGMPIAPLSFTDPDAGDQNPTWSLTLDVAKTGSDYNPIDVDAGGNLLLKSGMQLDYETQKQFFYTIRWESRGVVKTAELTLNVLNVQEPPVIVPGQTFVIAEDRTTTFGFVLATDPDFADRVNFTSGEYCKDNCELRYAIVGGNSGNAFTIDARSGALTPAVGVLDFENRAQYTLSIRVTDNSGSGTSVTESVTIYLTDVNDCTLTQAFLEDNSPLVVSTAGGTTMYFRGTNLGPTANREATAGMSSADTTITLMYQDTPTSPFLEFQATGCQLDRTKGDNTVVRCTSVPGVGSNLGLVMTVSVNYPEGTRVCVASVFGHPSAKVSYEAPEITGMIDHIGMPTNGTTTVTITGENFGPFAAYNVLTARYGKTATEYNTNCVLTQSNTQMECQVVPGVGKNLKWSVVVGGASSAPFGPSSYAVPHVQQLSGTLVMNTRGAETVTLSGRDFGPLGTPVAATYGQGTCTEYTATACTVLEAHTKASCKTVPGVGKDLQWCITIGEQTSDPSEPTTRYSTPVITKVLGAGTSRARTEGGDYILLQGDFFGPLDTDDFSYIVVEYGPSAQEYVAVDCVLRTPHTQIECLTAPGTGKDHSWRLWIDGQWSAINPAMTSYAAPVVGFYEGPGENDADTRGSQTVTLLGENFGTAASGKLEKVVYSRLNGTVFDATDSCAIIVDHRAIECLTLPGAGESLQWTVTVDGQVSELSSTDYAPPVITALSGLGAVNASVYGNQDVVITGNYFGPTTDIYGVKFLQSVTYGPTGAEYTAKDCVVQDDSTILCKTTQGVGQNLRWLVTVEGQMSQLSQATTSYALPELLSADPLVGHTSGGGLITLKGRNLATFNDPKTYFDGQEMVTSYTIGQDTIFATVPEGWGRHKEIFIEVGGARTTSVFFSYFDPHIDTVNAKPVEGSNATYLVVVEGTSFSADPKLYLTPKDGERVLLTNCPEKGHRTVACETTAVSGEVQIVLSDEIYSNVAFYDSSEPMVVQVRLDTGEARTVGGAVLEIVAQGLGTEIGDVSATVGGHPCVLGPIMEILVVGSLEYNTIAASLQQTGVFYLNTDFQRIKCTVPEGQGKHQSVVVTRGGLESLGCGCSLCTPVPCFDYLPPVITAVTPLESPTTGGGFITLTGDNFGLTPRLFVGGREWHSLNSTDANSTASHMELIVEIAAFEGASLEILLDVANQTAVAEQKFSYLPPTVDLIDDKPFVITDIPTTGTDYPITLTGSNFGVLGPLVTIGGVQVPLLDFDQDFVSFFVPEGQGANLPIVVDVSGQLSSVGSAFLSYAPPRVTSYWPLQLSGDTRGGEPITLIGHNFGLVTGNWKLAFTRKTETVSSGRRRLASAFNEVLVTPDLIVEWNHTYVEFITPPGQGQNRTLNFTVGGQVAEFPSTTLSFSYNRPSITGYQPTTGLVTEGGVILTILGTSFGVSNAVVTILDPLANSTNDRMTPKLCELLSQDHEQITCKLPAGVGGDLELHLNVDDSSDVFAFAYDPPVIDFFWSSSGGSAAGGEELRIYGQNFGSYRTPAEIYIDDTLCEGSLWLADDRTYDLQPYLRCPSTPAETVGPKNVTVRVAYQWSEPNDKYYIRCKTGFYGGVGEMCANCGDPTRTGYLCPRDDLYMPIAEEGWWLSLERTPHPRCHKEMQQRPACPAMWPCVPSDACLGNNTCAKGYDESSERCAQCELGYYRLNGRCEVCPTAPWLIFVVVVLAGIAVLYVGYLLAKKQVNVGILSIGVDYFQVLAIFSNSNVSWPSSLVYLWNVMSVFNLNIDIFAPECWEEVKISYKLKWTLIQIAPLAMFGIALAAFLGRLAYKVIVQKRRNKLVAHGYKLLGAVIIIFYYLYLYIANTTLAVFNCQAPEPPDGNYYMQDVGTDEGLCYKDGTLQQQLEPWAILCIVVYVVGFPLAVGLIIFFNSNSIFKDQLLRATRADKSQIRAAGTWNFRKRYQRLYYQFKPNWYFWILVILARKFCLSVVAVLFRNNTIFMLSVTMLVLFIAYVLQVRHGPYMSMSEYDDVAKANKPMVDELYASLPKRAMQHNASSRRKQIKFGEKMSSVEAQNLRMLGHHAFFNDYNTVESVLLCSAVVVALSGIMFESGQLSRGLKEFVTIVVILIVVLTISYFIWVLTTEVWIAFYPGTPILWCYDPWSKEDPAVEDMELQDAFEVSAGGKHATTGGDDMSAAQKQYQLENAVLAETVAMQQNEIAQLKKANKALELAKMNAPKKQVKQKREFKTSQHDLTLEADDSTTPL